MLILLCQQDVQKKSEHLKHSALDGLEEEEEEDNDADSGGAVADDV